MLLEKNICKSNLLLLCSFINVGKLQAQFRIIGRFKKNLIIFCFMILQGVYEGYFEDVCLQWNTDSCLLNFVKLMSKSKIQPTLVRYLFDIKLIDSRDNHQDIIEVKKPAKYFPLLSALKGSSLRHKIIKFQTKSRWTISLRRCKIIMLHLMHNRAKEIGTI